ncbi:MAG: hypothetical protein ACT4OG_10385 [Alphaproteobacteria bacterium]
MTSAKKDYTPSMSDEAVKAKTGMDWYGWFKLLDKEEANKLTHTEIANLLYNKHKVPGWWCQMVAVEYERARGLRETHQKPDGYSVSVSKTLFVPLSRLYRAVADAATRKKWFPSEFEPSSQTKDKYFRGPWRNGARLEMNFYAKGAGKSQVTIQVNKLAKKSDVEKERAAWKKAFEKLEKILS